MAVQKIPDTYFYRLDSQRIDGNLSRKDGLVVDQFYIKIDDYDNFDADQDVDVYKIISSTQADVYKANKYNYQSVPNVATPSSPKNNSLYQSVTINGKAISRIICNNKLIWQKQVRSTSASGGWQQLWQGTLSFDDIKLPAYRLYLFKSGSNSFTKSANDLIGSYESINDNTLSARYDHSNNQLLIRGFGQNPIEIYGKN